MQYVCVIYITCMNGENFYPAETGDGSIQANIESLICSFRGHQVMIDRDIAMLYGVETKRLNEQVRRNIERFPSDFMFQLREDKKINEVVSIKRHQIKADERIDELFSLMDKYNIDEKQGVLLTLKHTTTMKFMRYLRMLHGNLRVLIVGRSLRVDRVCLTPYVIICASAFQHILPQNPYYLTMQCNHRDF